MFHSSIAEYTGTMRKLSGERPATSYPMTRFALFFRPICYSSSRLACRQLKIGRGCAQTKAMMLGSTNNTKNSRGYSAQQVFLCTMVSIPTFVRVCAASFASFSPRANQGAYLFISTGCQLSGRVNVKVVPLGPSACFSSICGSRCSSPPCASIIERAVCKPKPTPRLVPIVAADRRE